MSSRITIDPDGDVLLQIPYQPPLPPPSPVPLPAPDLANPNYNSRDDDPSVATKSQAVDKKTVQTRQLLVSSKILSVASPVYRAMLCGKFSEGVALSTARTCSNSVPFQLPLPEDDAEAMTLLCRLLHFETGDLPDRPSPELLENLAAACDKYICIPALKYCGGLWVRNWLLHYEKTVPVIDDICRLLVFTYVADLKLEFSELAWKLLLHHEGPLVAEHTQAVILIDHPLLHQDVLRRLEFKRWKFCEEYHRAVMAPFMTWNWASLTEGCFQAAKAIARYTKALRDARVFPHDLEFTKHRFIKLLSAADQMIQISVEACGSNAYRNRACPCSQDMTKSLEEDLKSVVKLIRSDKPWFGCLDCLKETSGADGKCRAEHHPFTERTKRM